MSEIFKETLDNGVRVLCEPLTYVGSVSVGLWCMTGSANERDDEAGVTHLIEHMLFKGTKTRTAKQIAEEIEGRGGMLNAFTDKESTCYYCRSLDRDVEVAIDVLAEMVTGSLIAPADLEIEKHVVLEEIKRSEDEPSDHVHDLHLQYRWPGHALGKPVIGTPQSVASFTHNDLAQYIERRYTGGNVVLAVAGNVRPPEVVEAANKHLGSLRPGGDKLQMPRPKGVASNHEVGKEVEQVHFCIGADAYSFYDEDRYAAMVLDATLGGGMSSRLFQEVREKRGLTYAIGSYSLTYSAGGSFTIYGGTGPDKWQEVQKVVRDELDKVIEGGVEPGEMAKVKRALAGNLVIALESMSTRMMRMTRNEIVYGKEVTVEDVLARIEAVTNDDLRCVASRLLAPELVSTTAIGPFG